MKPGKSKGEEQTSFVWWLRYPSSFTSMCTTSLSHTDLGSVILHSSTNSNIQPNDGEDENEMMNYHYCCCAVWTSSILINPLVCVTLITEQNNKTQETNWNQPAERHFSLVWVDNHHFLFVNVTTWTKRETVIMKTRWRWSPLSSLFSICLFMMFKAPH